MLDDAKDSSSVVGVRLGLSDSNDENVDVDDVDDWYDRDSRGAGRFWRADEGWRSDDEQGNGIPTDEGKLAKVGLGLGGDGHVKWTPSLSLLLLLALGV